MIWVGLGIGFTVGVIGVLCWLAWYFKDVMK